MRADEGRQLSLFSYEELIGPGRPARVGAEPREYPEAPTRARSTEGDELDATTGNTGDLLERICSRENMREACERVAGNGGAGGVDGMGVAELPAWLANRFAIPTADRAGDALTTDVDDTLVAALRPCPMRADDLARALGTTFLDTLHELAAHEAAGVVERLPDGRYSLSVRAYRELC